MKNPIQPLYKDTDNVLRFKKNAVVDHLLHHARKYGCGLNQIAQMDFSQDDRQQFAQLIGYSLTGYGELSYVTHADYAKASKDDKRSTRSTRRIAELEKNIADIRESFKAPTAALFCVNPDSLNL